MRSPRALPAGRLGAPIRRLIFAQALSAAGAICSIVFVVALLCAARTAEASAWVLPKGRLVLGLSGTFSVATSEFLPDGTFRRFPLRGRFESYDLQLLGRYGLGAGFELSVNTALKGISYRADPVILFSGSPPSSTNAFRDSVFDFSHRDVGLSDIYISVSHQHLKRPLHIASQLEVKLPTGYRQPAATFAQDDASPGLITDDVALGDGQVDLTYRLEAGYVLRKTLTIFELSAGYRVRLNGPGHQALGSFKLGQVLGKHIVLLGGVEGAVTLFSGNVIGSSFVAIDPDQPASRFNFDENVELRLLRLDRTFLAVNGGAIIRYAGREWVVRVAHVLYGKNYSKLTSVSIGLLLSFS
jgi:hypothetical protein